MPKFEQIVVNGFTPTYYNHISAAWHRVKAAEYIAVVHLDGEYSIWAIDVDNDWMQSLTSYYKDMYDRLPEQIKSYKARELC